MPCKPGQTISFSRKIFLSAAVMVRGIYTVLGMPCKPGQAISFSRKIFLAAAVVVRGIYTVLGMPCKPGQAISFSRKIFLSVAVAAGDTEIAIAMLVVLGIVRCKLIRRP
jgi:hypothetical protein